MERIVTIAGNPVRLEVGRPLPAAKRSELRGREKGAFRLLLEAMRPGESVFLPLTKQAMKSKTPTVTTAAKATGKRYAVRAEGDGYRIYCLAPTTAERTNVSANGTGTTTRRLESVW